MSRRGKPIFIPIYFEAFLADVRVQRMTAEQIGCYFLLILCAWQDDPACTLPNDESMLARQARVPLNRWKKIGPQVMECWRLQDGRWHQDRLRAEYDKAVRKMDEASDKGRRGARNRWGNDGTGNSTGIAPANAPANGTGNAYAYASKNKREINTKDNPQTPTPIPPSLAALGPSNAAVEIEAECWVIAEIRKEIKRDIGAVDRNRLAEIQAEFEAIDPPVIEGKPRPWPEVWGRAVRFAMASISNHSPKSVAAYAKSCALSCVTSHVWPGNDKAKQPAAEVAKAREYVSNRPAPIVKIEVPQ